MFPEGEFGRSVAEPDIPCYASAIAPKRQNGAESPLFDYFLSCSFNSSMYFFARSYIAALSHVLPSEIRFRASRASLIVIKFSKTNRANRKDVSQHPQKLFSNRVNFENHPLIV